MDVGLLILRVLHITAGVIWAGGGVVSVAFINPTAKSLQQDAAGFMKHINFVRRFPIWMGISGLVNVLTGSTLYYRLFGDQVAFSTNREVALTLGALFGTSAILIGLGMMLPVGNKLEKLLIEIEAGGGAPSPEQGGKMAVMQEKLMRRAVMVTGLLILAVIAMSASGVV